MLNILQRILAYFKKFSVLNQRIHLPNQKLIENAIFFGTDILKYTKIPTIELYTTSRLYTYTKNLQIAFYPTY